MRRAPEPQQGKSETAGSRHRAAAARQASTANAPAPDLDVGQVPPAQRGSPGCQRRPNLGAVLSDQGQRGSQVAQLVHRQLLTELTQRGPGGDPPKPGILKRPSDATHRPAVTDRAAVISASGTPRPPARFIATKSRKLPTTWRKSRRASAARLRTDMSGRKKQPAPSRIDNQRGTTGETPKPSRVNNPPSSSGATKPTAAAITLVARKPSNDMSRIERSCRIDVNVKPRLASMSRTDEPRSKRARCHVLAPAARAGPFRPASIAPSAAATPGRNGTSARTNRNRPSPTRAPANRIQVMRRPAQQRREPSGTVQGTSKRDSRRNQANATAKITITTSSTICPTGESYGSRYDRLNTPGRRRTRASRRPRSAPTAGWNADRR